MRRDELDKSYIKALIFAPLAAPPFAAISTYVSMRMMEPPATPTESAELLAWAGITAVYSLIFAYPIVAVVGTLLTLLVRRGAIRVGPATAAGIGGLSGLLVVTPWLLFGYVFAAVRFWLGTTLLPGAAVGLAFWWFAFRYLPASPEAHEQPSN
jgi:hypothetical protein